MAIKKSELYSSLWESCDELRGGMDASQYKDYVLVLLFVKYVSDKYAGQPDALIEVPEGGGFADPGACPGDNRDPSRRGHSPLTCPGYIEGPTPNVSRSSVVNENRFEKLTLFSWCIVYSHS